MESLKERGSVDTAGLMYSFSMVFATGLRGLWNGGLGFAYRSMKTLRGLSGSCWFALGVEVVFNSLSNSEGKGLRPDFPYLSTGEEGRLISPKSKSEAERPCDEGLRS